jgi:hypothetical protein
MAAAKEQQLKTEDTFLANGKASNFPFSDCDLPIWDVGGARTAEIRPRCAENAGYGKGAPDERISAVG